MCNECLARHHRHCWREGGERCSACLASVAAGVGGDAAAKPGASAAASAPTAIPGSSLTDLAPDVRERLERELQPGERILWTGQPAPWRTLRVAATLAVAVFGLPWTAFATLMLLSFANDAVEHGGLLHWTPVVMLSCFVLVGVGMLAAPLWGLRGAARTAYAVTSQRVILVEGEGWRAVSVRVYGREALASLIRIEHEDGSGDLVLEETPGRNGVNYRRGLMAIPRVREVEALLRSVLAR